MIFEKKIEEMIRRLEAKGIDNPRVLQAMRKVPRHYFVAPGMELQAYDEKALPIGFGQTISHPYTVALMTQILNPKSGERILEIGTGSGYQAAILSEMGATVFSIEKVRDLALRAERRLKQLGYGYRVLIRIGDGSLGWAAHAPYDAIIFTAGAPHAPEHLFAQLDQGGRLLVPIGEKDEQILTLFIKEQQKIVTKEISKLRFVPLKGAHGWQS